MSCEQLSERLPDYWAGRLSGEEARALEAHLASCPACRAEADALTATWEALGALATADGAATAAEEPSAALRGRFDAMLTGWRDRDADARAEARPEEAVSRAARAGRIVPAADRELPARVDFDAVPASADRSGGPVLPMRPRTAWTRAWRPAAQVAAALLCVIGGFAAGRAWPNPTARTEMADLRQELRDMRQMMTLTLLQQQSASERLRGVTWSAQVDRPGGEVLAALQDTLAHDPNVNVRLAAIDALKQFAQDSGVRRGLIAELAADRQSSPLVQLSLIDALVDMKEHESVAALRALAADQHANDAVRRRATWGVETLTRS